MQAIAVAVIVALAVVYAAWKLMPRALRARLAQVTVGWAQRRASLSDQDAAALARRLAASGCGSCDSCGTCGTGPDPAVASNESVLRFTQRESSTERTSH